MAVTNSNLFDVQVVVPTPLAAAAAAMQPGSWTTLSTNLAGAASLSDLIDAGGGHRITEYADKMVWLSARKEIYFTGGGHATDEKTIVYTDVDNTWRDLGTPPWYSPPSGGAIHGYQHNTARGNTHYYLIFGSSTIRTRDITTNTWGTLNTSGLNLGSGGAIGSLEWFPTFGTGSLIVVYGNANAVYRWNGSSWSTVGSPSMGGYHNVGVYDPFHNLLYFGGGNGSSALYTMSSTGTITPRASCPVEFGTIQSVTTVDPVSGKLVLVCRDRVIRVYDPVANSWSVESTAPPPGFWSGNIYNEGDVMGILAAPIYDYGVTMFLTISGPTVYLRKGR